MSREELRELARQVLGTSRGQELLEELERVYGGRSHVAGDPHETAFREGRREMMSILRGLLRHE